MTDSINSNGGFMDCLYCIMGVPSVWDHVFDHYAHQPCQGEKLVFCESPWSPRLKGKYPLTAEFLRLHEKWREARDGRAPTLAWAYGATLDRNDMARVPALVAMGVRHGG